MSDVFDPPDSASAPVDDVVRSQARKTLYRDGAGAVGLALFSWCCNPCFIFSFLSIGGAMQVLRQTRWMKIALEEDYPEDAGTAATVMAVLAIIIAVFGVLLQFLGSAIRVSERLG